MRLLVLGASGGCGRFATRLAADRGHRVTAVVRPETPFDPPTGADVVRRDVLADGALDDLPAGHDAVLFCLGIRRVNPRNPWSSLASPPDLAARTVRGVAAGMRRHAVDRIVAISAAGVGDSADRMNAVMRGLVRWSRVGDSYRDLAVMERELAASGLDWLAVRPTTLVDGAPTGRVREVRSFRLTSTIRRGDVAAWMLDAIARPGRFRRRTPMISSA